VRNPRYGIFKNKVTKPFLGNPNPNNSISTYLYDSETNEYSVEFLDSCLQAIHSSITNPSDFRNLGLNYKDLECINSAPGEHYQLLSKIIEHFEVSSALEIGTFRGLGSLAIALNISGGGTTFTNDLVEWNKFDSVLNSNLLLDLNISQILTDFSRPENLSLLGELASKIDLIFLDGPKDGIFEYEFLRHLHALGKNRVRLLFIDDIKFENMIPLWRSIKSPKMDLTSFGHWSGSGLVDISKGIEIDFNYWKV
jgi:predicted O-methyltransferase YrrM